MAIAIADRRLRRSRPCKVDERLPSYTPTQGVSGTIKSVGSDTLNNLMTLWAEKFKEFYPNVQIEIEGKGSSTAPPAAHRGRLQPRPDEPTDEGRRDRRVREAFRLQAGGQ